MYTESGRRFNNESGIEGIESSTSPVSVFPTYQRLTRLSRFPIITGGGMIVLSNIIESTIFTLTLSRRTLFPAAAAFNPAVIKTPIKILFKITFLLH
jgi:hypothetical protein